MTFSSASRLDDRSPDPVGRDGLEVDRPDPPAEAVSLADLIADTGPLPPDAALECVQRIAERLTSAHYLPCDRLEPSDVFIDDDGDVWIRDYAACEASHQPSQEAATCGDFDRLGRLLAFLATGDNQSLAAGSTVDIADLPIPLSSVAGRLLSRNGSCYRSYAEVARDAAELRGIHAASDGQSTDNSAPRTDAAFGPRFAEVSSSAVADGEPVLPAAISGLEEAETLPSDAAEPHQWLGLAVVIMIAVGAGVALMLWRLL